MSGIRARRIGGNAGRFLACVPAVGSVVSAFRLGVNVSLLQDGCEAIVSLQTADVPLHPWAIEVPREWAPVRVGSTCRAAGGAIDLESSSSILLRDARTDEMRITGYNAGQARRAQSRYPFLRDVVDRARRRLGSDPFFEQIEGIIRGWWETRDSAALLALVGRGIGSTPSGDDVLIGIAAGLTACAEASTAADAALGSIRDRFVREGQLATPLFSAQAVRAAMDGAFHEAIRHLIEQCGNTSASRLDLSDAAVSLARVGASSGAASAYGVMTAMLEVLT